MSDISIHDYFRIVKKGKLEFPSWVSYVAIDQLGHIFIFEVKPTFDPDLKMWKGQEGKLAEKIGCIGKREHPEKDRYHISKILYEFYGLSVFNSLNGLEGFTVSLHRTNFKYVEIKLIETVNRDGKEEEELLFYNLIELDQEQIRFCAEQCFLAASIYYIGDY